MLKANENSLGALHRGMYVYTFKKMNFVSFGRRIEKMFWLMG